MTTKSRIELESMSDGLGSFDLPGLSGPVAPERPLSAAEIKLWSRIAFYEAIYSLVGLSVGLAVILIGSGLVIRGITGATSWTTRILDLESTLSDAGPGVLLFVVGVFVVWITRFDFKVARRHEKRSWRRRS